MDLFIRNDNNDLEIINGDFRTDASLHTVVLLSLKANARADDDEITEGDNPRGWWASDLGSKLWLAERLKILPNTPIRIEEYISEALQHLIDDGIARRINVNVRVQRNDHIFASVQIIRRDGAEESFVWNNLWEELIGSHHELERVETGAPVTDYLLTQSGDILITQDGDRLVWR